MKARRAISPVIATVIIVAVAIAISIAVAGWLFGLWGGFAGGSPAVSIPSATVILDTTGATPQVEAQLYVVNEGAGSDNIYKAELIVGGQTFNATLVTDGTNNADLTANETFTIEANSKGFIYVDFDSAANAISPGDSVTIKVYFEKSGVVPVTAVVSSGTVTNT
ncbi:MAG: hypothetical protein F7B20_06570 [Aeropyrum sp.]|nr:hypothetical protein [Aeropyrum sp.]